MGTALHFACRRGSTAHAEMLFKIEDIEIDEQTSSGVTPLMMAVSSGKTDLIASCLNNNCNPFYHDALNRKANDYAAPFTDVLGVDVRQLIDQAMAQWISQIPDEAERMQGQMEFGNQFTEF